ncbi:hypothetical protein [Streptomyces sp. NPDC093261]|uniref:hypothetical protein n=1 Tax=Streptomyces sp. NPDC093261 TaxID=3366037 RepID=UPI003802F911
MRQGGHLGHLPGSVDPEKTAAALLAGLRGGVAILLSTGRSAHLRAALDWGIARLGAASQEAWGKAPPCGAGASAPGRRAPPGVPRRHPVC